MDRRQRVIAGSLLGVLAILILITGPARDARNDADPRVSTFRSTANGARALYLALDELGVPVGRWLHSFAESDTLPPALAVLAPTQPLTPHELTGLRAWLAGGGTLFYVARPDVGIQDALGLALDRLPDRDQAGAEDRSGRSRRRVAPAPHPWTQGMAPVRRRIRWAFSDTSARIVSGEAEPLLVTQDGEIVALTFALGDGRVVAWSDHRALTNAELRESGALLLFVRAVEALRRGDEPLAFDEFHHGYRAGGGPARATLYFLQHEPWGHAVLQLALAGMGLLLLLGRRFGAPVPVLRAERRSPIEHVEALAGAYHRVDARRRARHLIVAGLMRRLGRRPPATPEEERRLLETLARRGSAGADAAARLLDEWDKGSHGDLHVVAREADRILLEVRSRW